MRKILLLITAIFWIASLKAQVQFGLKGGCSLSDLYFSGQTAGNNSRSKSGFNAGVFSTIHLFNSFLLIPEISYSEEGLRAEDSSNTVNYNYLNVPILLKYQHQSGIFIETGPQIGFYLNSNTNLGGMNTDLKSVSNSTAFSWVFGTGYKTPAFPLGLDIRYNWGISNIETYTIFTTRSSVLQIDLFYVFK